MTEQQTVLPLDCRPDDSPKTIDPPASAQTERGSAQLDRSGWIEVVKRMSSFPAMLGAFLIGRVFYQARMFFVDPDVWWHIRIGQDIASSHHWPTTAPYSLTASNMPWIAYEWLGEVILGRAARLGGISGLFVLLTICAALAMTGLYYLGSLRSGNCKAGFVPAGLLCSLAFVSFTLRPQMFGYLFLLALLIVLEWFRRGVSWPLWTLPLLFLLWVNTHGSFIVGIGVLAVYLCAGLKAFELGSVQAAAWSAKQRMQLELALLASLAVLPLTPYGAELAAYPFDMMFKQPINLASMSEWQPMPFDQRFGQIFLGVVIVVVLLQMMFRFTWRLEEVLLALGGTVMACLHARMVMLFVPFLAPIFATMIARLLPAYDRAKEHYVLNGVLIAGVTLAMVHYFPSRDLLEKKVETVFPVRAVEYLDAHQVPGPMLNTYFFGGYLVNSGRRVFIDGRGDLYEKSGVLADYIVLSQLEPGAFGVLERYGVASCLLHRNEKLSVALALSADWKQVYSDQNAALFVRAPSPGGEVSKAR